MNAGSDLLNHYQNQWHELHGKNEQNANLAMQLAKSINQIDSETKKHHAIMSEFLYQLSTLPQIEKTISSIENELVKLKHQFFQIEQKLTLLEIDKQKQDFDKIKLDHQYQLAVYKEKRASEFETVKVRLALDHTKKVQEYEQQQQSILKERQEAFQAAFEEELNYYKTQGKIEKKEVKFDSPKIEEIIVADEAEEAALAKFLEDSTEEN